MPARPLSFDHVAMGFAHALSERHGKRAVALAIPSDWDGNAGSLFAAVDTSATHVGHGAIVNLIQGAKRHGLSSSNLWIYHTGVPTHADKGMFIEQIHDNSYLHVLDAGNILSIRPSQNNRHGAPIPSSKPPVHENAAGNLTTIDDRGSWWLNVLGDRRRDPAHVRFRGQAYQLPLALGQIAKTKALLKARTDAVWVYNSPLPGFAPRVTLPPAPIAEMFYAQLEDHARMLFDSIFVYTALSLVPARGGFAADASPVRGKGGNNVGSVLVSWTGEILSWGLNFGRLNATLHAEVSVIKDWQARNGGIKLPEQNSRLYTSLEPCFMCAGQLAAYHDVPGFTIIYVQTDPKFHPKPTFLTDAGFETAKADDLGLVYRGKGTGWSSRLAVTQARLALNAPSAKVRKSYAESAISVLNKEASQVRRFAKAAFDLAAMGEKLLSDDDLSGAEREMLMETWAGAMKLVMIVGGHVPADGVMTALRVREYLNAVGRYLDDTQGQNKARAAVEAAYRKRRSGIIIVNKYQMRGIALAERLAEGGLVPG